MYARYRVDTRRLLHWSTTQFTTACDISEADCQISNSALPDQIEKCRLVLSLDSIEIDPTYIPPTLDVSSMFDNLKTLKAFAIACSNLTVAGIVWSVAGYTPAQIKTRFIAVYNTL